jgi:hypothetical protein
MYSLKGFYVRMLYEKGVMGHYRLDNIPKLRTRRF